MKKPGIKDIIIWIFILASLGCAKDDENTPLRIDSYPMNIGTEWTYDRQLIIQKYDDITPNKISEIDTIYFVEKVWIEKDTVLNDTMNVTVFKSVTDANNSTPIEYNYMDNEGLKNYAYSNAGSNIFPIKHKGTTLYGVPFQTNQRALSNDYIHFTNPPSLKIKYPLENNTSWNYIDKPEVSSIRIDKKVVGAERLEIKGHHFDCFKVNWDYTFNQQKDDNYIMDWIASEGLIKRVTIFDTISFTDETGKILFTAHTTDTYTLKELIIK